MSDQQPSSGKVPGPVTAQQVRADLAAVRAELLGALEQGQEKRLSQAEVVALRAQVNDAITAYQSLLAATPEAERPDLEHSLGRQVIDLRRTAGQFPQFSSGTAVKHSKDRIPGGGQPFIETRTPGRSILGDDRPALRRGERPTVTSGSEVDAWCGPCGGLRAHNVFAVVDGQPKQVICQACGARHGFRLTPARQSKPKEESALPMMTTPYRPRKSPEEQAEERRREEQAKLRDQLAKVEGVQAFDPRRRYKAGQVIEHPEHGRGKIENVLRSSVLVRFPIGLRSLMLK